MLLHRINNQEGYYGGQKVSMNSEVLANPLFWSMMRTIWFNYSQRALKSAGFDTIPFDKPTKALEYVREYHSKILLVLTDWRMPQISGLELTKKVSEIDDKLKVVLMSAYELEKY